MLLYASSKNKNFWNLWGYYGCDIPLHNLMVELHGLIRADALDCVGC